LHLFLLAVLVLPQCTTAVLPAAVASLRQFGKRAAANYNVVNPELVPADRQAEAYKRTSLSAHGDHKMNQDLIMRMLTCSSIA